jgi:hypothetical protein
MHSSMSEVLTCPHPVLRMYTSSSRTDSTMRTLDSPIPDLETSARATEMPRLMLKDGEETEIFKTKKNTVERQCLRAQDDLFLCLFSSIKYRKIEDETDQ